MRKQVRLSRDEWLRRALEHIADVGHAKVRVYKLAKTLGVTEGSFYWHFKNRQDFLAKLVEYWGKNFTSVVVDAVNCVDGDARARLSALINKVTGEDLSGFDRVMWAMAIQEPALAPAISRVYSTRIDYVSSLFSEMGFRDRELDLRTRSFVAFMSMENNYFKVKSQKKRLKLIEEVLAYYTKP